MTLTDLDLAFDNTALAMNATERLCYDDSLSSFWSALPERSDDGALNEFQSIGCDFAQRTFEH